MGDGLVTLLILACVTVFLVMRLKSVLGTKTGFEKKPESVFSSRDNTGSVEALEPDPVKPLDENDPLSSVFSDMRAIESGFDPSDFANGARRAYEMLLMAFENGDKATLQEYLAPDVFQGFAAAIDTRIEQGLTVEARFVGVREARIIGARLDPEDNVAEIDIRFVGELVTVVRDAEHRIVEGDPNEIVRQTDVWTFGRRMGAPDPNWLLIATDG